MSLILTAIRDRLDDLSSRERLIAEFILHQPGRIVQMGIVELARQSGASPATISRFCRHFQFSGYPDFRMKLTADLAGRKSPNTYQDIVEGNPLEQIILGIEANNVRAVTETTRLLDLQQMAKAIEALLNADRIALFGMATSGVVAQDFMQKLVRIGKNASAFTDTHMQITAASALGAGDVAIAISYSGETPETIDAMLCASEQGCTTISISQFGSSELSRSAHIALFVSPLEKGLHRGDMASRIALLHMIDVLFTGMLSEHFQESVPRLEQTYQRVQQSRNKINKGRKQP